MELAKKGKVPIGMSAILYVGGDTTFDIDYPFKREEFRSRAVGAMIGKYTDSYLKASVSTRHQQLKIGNSEPQPLDS